MTRPPSNGQPADPVSAIHVYTEFDTPLGLMRISAQAGRPHEGLTGAWFVHDQKHLPPLTPAWRAVDDEPLLRHAQEALAAWFAGRQQRVDVPLAPQGTPFQQSVWHGLLAIPYGETVSYGQLTERIGQPPTAVRAVGGAIGRNPISIVIPCHRVVGSRGDLTGFAGGLSRKRFLLELEQAGRWRDRPFALEG